MIKICHQTILETSPENAFRILLSPEVSKIIYSEIESIERKVSDVPLHEGEEYKATWKIGASKVEQVVRVKKIITDKMIVCISKQKYIEIEVKSEVNLLPVGIQLLNSYEVNFTNFLLLPFAPLYARRLAKYQFEKLQLLYKHIDVNFDPNKNTYKARVWGMSPLLAAFLLWITIVISTVTILQVFNL